MDGAAMTLRDYLFAPLVFLLACQTGGFRYACGWGRT